MPETVESESISLTASRKVKVTPELIASVSAKLHDTSANMGHRFRALYTLRNLGGKLSIDALVHSLKVDSSALLKHEIAYCLGQMRDSYAIPFLVEVLGNTEEESIVRHEAGEALGAIGTEECLPPLEQYAQDPIAEVRETCEVALARIRWGQQKKQKLSSHPRPESPAAAPKKEGDEEDEFAIPEPLPVINKEDPLGPSPIFHSVDPAPPMLIEQDEEDKLNTDVDYLQKVLTDYSLPIFERYKALFALRDIRTDRGIDALLAGLSKEEPSALLKHEIAFVLGQLQHGRAAEVLNEVLHRQEEHPMVRHEALEALGAIDSPDVEEILNEHLKDPQIVVKESAIVALDMTEYYNSDAFEYADGVVKHEASQSSD